MTSHWLDNADLDDIYRTHDMDYPDKSDIHYLVSIIRLLDRELVLANKTLDEVREEASKMLGSLTGAVHLPYNNSSEIERSVS